MSSRRVLRPQLNIESLECRLVPASFRLDNITMTTVAFTRGADGTEQWTGLATTSDYLTNDISTQGVLTPLGEHASRITVMQSPGYAPALDAMSRHNGWVVGHDIEGTYLWNSQSPTKPRKLAGANGSTGLITFFPTSVSDSGVVSGTLLTNTSHYVPAYWSPSTGLRAFSVPAEFGGTATGINSAGTLAVGQVTEPTFGRSTAAVFSRTGTAILLDNNGYDQSEASAMTDDGSLVAGRVHVPFQFVDGDFISEYYAASVWDQAGQHTLQWADGSTVKMAQYSGKLHITNDGYILGNSTAGDFIWHPSFNGIDSPFLGAQPFNDWFYAVTGETPQLPSSIVFDIARSENGALYFPVSNFSSQSQLLIVADDPSLVPTFPQSTILNAQGTASNDYFYINPTGYTQINIDAGASADAVQILKRASDEPNPYTKAKLVMGEGNDQIAILADGVYTLQLDAGNDRVIAGSVFSQPFDLTLNVLGGAGNDSLTPTWAKVTADLGAGDDYIDGFMLYDGSSFDTGDGNDRVSLDMLNNATILTGKGDDDVGLRYAINCVLKTGTGNDHVDYYAGEGTQIFTEAGNDKVDLNTDSSANQTKVYLGDGNDTTLIGGFGILLWAGAGNDVATFNGGSGNIVRMEAGNDRVIGTDGPNYIDLGDGNDSYETDANGARDTVLGGNGNDTFRLLAGSVKAFGEAGNDTFTSTAGNHFISGGTGYDRYASLGTANVIDLGTNQLNILSPVAADQLVRHANDYFTRPNMPYLSITRQQYLDLLAPILADLQSQGLRRPQY